MFKKIWSVVDQIVGSKKALVFLAGLLVKSVAMLLAKKGWVLDAAMEASLSDFILKYGAAYLIGQGFADLGKEKAKIEAGSE